MAYKVLNLSNGVYLYSINMYTEQKKDTLYPTKRDAEKAIDKILGFTYLESECKPIKEHFEIIDMLTVN